MELQNEAMDQNASVFNQNNIGASNGNYEFQNQTLLGNFHDFSFNHLTSEGIFFPPFILIDHHKKKKINIS